MDKLKELLALDPSALLPELPGLLEKLAPLCRWAVMVVPVLLTVLGLVYLFLAPREANHELGWRCWWGMSSVAVWRFAQKLSGIVWTAMGVVMGIVMFIIGTGYPTFDPDELLMKAVLALVWQIGLVIASILGVNLTLVILFDSKGIRRSEKQKV